MNVDIIAAVLSIVLLTLLNALFTLAKTSLVTVRHAGLAHAISAAGDANTATAGSVLAPNLEIQLLPLHLPHPFWLSTIILTLVVAFFSMIFGELVPYAYAQRHPGRAATAIARPIEWFVTGFSAFADIALGVSNLLVKPFGLTATFASPLITEDELRTLLEASAASGAIEEDEKEIIRNVISFGDTDVSQVMTPRTDMTAAPVDMGCEALVDLIVQSGHSRIPIFEGAVDSIDGIVQAKDLLPAQARGEKDRAGRGGARRPGGV